MATTLRLKKLSKNYSLSHAVELLVPALCITSALRNRSATPQRGGRVSIVTGYFRLANPGQSSRGAHVTFAPNQRRCWRLAIRLGFRPDGNLRFSVLEEFHGPQPLPRG